MYLYQFKRELKAKLFKWWLVKATIFYKKKYMTKKKIYFYRINKNYIDYLRNFDKNVRKKPNRVYIGIVLSLENYNYFVPLSSPKTKHQKMKNNIDFLKIDKGNLGVLNFNNMIPVDKKDLLYIDFSNIQDIKYKNLLINQYRWIDSNKIKIFKKAEKLYNKFIKNELIKNVKERCCNFLLLEDKLEL